VFIFFRDTNLTNVLFRIDATWSREEKMFYLDK